MAGSSIGFFEIAFLISASIVGLFGLCIWTIEHRRRVKEMRQAIEFLKKNSVEREQTSEPFNPPRVVTARPNKNGKHSPIHMDDQRAWTVEQESKRDNRTRV